MAPGPSTDCLKACGHVADIEDVDSFRNRRAPTIALCVLGLLVLGQMLRTQVTLQSGPFTRIVDDYLYNATQFAFSLAVVWRAWSVSRERTAWGVIGISLLTWSSGNVVWNLLVSDGHTGASVADAFWLVAYPGLYAGLWLLFRGRVAGVTRASVLDGLVVGLAVAAIASATLFDALWTHAPRRACQSAAGH